MIDLFSVFDDDDEDKKPTDELTEEQKDTLVCGVLEDWINYSDAIRGKLEKSAENWQMYLENEPADNGVVDPTETEGDANVRSGVMASIIDGMHAQMSLAAFPAQTSFFTPRPMNKLSAKKIVEYEKLCIETNKRLNLLDNASRDVKQLLLDGTSAVWHPFVRIEGKKATYSGMNGLIDPNADDFQEDLLTGTITRTEVETVECEGTGFYPILFDDWRVDPLVDNIDSTPFIWRRWVFPEDLQDDFENLDDVAPYTEVWSGDSFDHLKRRYQDLTISQDVFSEWVESSREKAGKQAVCLVEKWGDFYVDGKLYRNHVLICSNFKTFHYFGPNPYQHGQKPFTITQMVTIPGSLYGKTTVTDGLPLAQTIDKMYCQMLDTMSHNSDAAYTFNPMDESLREWIQMNRRVRPGDMVPQSSPGSLQPLPSNLSGISALDGLIKQASEMLRDVTGGVPYATGGAATPNDKTLGEVEILAAATSSRFQTVLQNYERQRLTPFVSQQFDNFRQFMTEAVILDEFQKKLRPEVVQLLEYRFDVTGSRSVLNKARRIDEYKEGLNLTSQLVGGGVATLKPINKQINAEPLIDGMLKEMNLPADQILEKQEAPLNDPMAGLLQAQQNGAQVNMGGIG